MTRIRSSLPKNYYAQRHRTDFSSCLHSNLGLWFDVATEICDRPGRLGLPRQRPPESVWISSRAGRLTNGCHTSEAQEKDKRSFWDSFWIMWIVEKSSWNWKLKLKKWKFRLIFEETTKYCTPLPFYSSAYSLWPLLIRNSSEAWCLSFLNLHIFVQQF